MRHVTDGELHAFLDGALDLLPEDRGEEVRDHISSCPVCSERLQDEGVLRSQAENILGNPDLGLFALPTFEELRERAETSGSDPILPTKEKDAGIHYRGPVKGLPLAWAATIVLALGVGWMGGQIWETLPNGGRPGGPASMLAPTQPPAAESADLDARSPLLEEPESLPSDVNSSQAPTVLEEAVGNLDPSAALPGVALDRQRRISDEGSQEAILASDPTALQLPSASGARAMREGDRVTDSAVTAGDALNLDSMWVLAASKLSAGDAAAPLGAFRADEVVVDPGSLENSLALKGLKVVSIGWEERVPGEKALLIRQLLSPGDTLELRYLGMLLGTDFDLQGLRERGIPLEDPPGGRAYANVLEASLPPGWHQVVMERGRGLLVARGPISEANLKALLKTLH